MKTYVTFSKPDVEVNKESRETTVTLAFKLNLVKTLGLNHVGYALSLPSVVKILDKVEYDHNTHEVFFSTVGVSKCSTEDEWDDNKGYRIASTRAQEQAHKVAVYFLIQLEYAIAEDSGLHNLVNTIYGNVECANQSVCHCEDLINDDELDN